MEEDSGATNHSSSMNASCNHSNVSQNMHNKRISRAPSLEMLPLVSAEVPEDVAETQTCDKQSERKCAASQTSEESLKEGVQDHEIEDFNQDIFTQNNKQLCRCPNCSCQNCTRGEKRSIGDQDKSVNDGCDEDADSGTESYTNEESRRKLSVSSFGTSSASVLIHDCIVSRSND